MKLGLRSGGVFPAGRVNRLRVCLLWSGGVALLAGSLWAQTPEPTKVVVPEPAARELQRVNYHPANSRRTPAPEPGQENTPLISPLEKADGSRITSPSEWYGERRPEIRAKWLEILGKLTPTAEDMKWFGDVTKVRILSTEEKEHYTRIDLEIPLEVDFYQKHLLLLPRGQGEGPFPAVIAWTSSTPDYQKPEEWWGSYLASHGYVVLTSWSFIRHYRDDVDEKQINEKVYSRFGHWLPMAKMVHDVEREAEYLRSRWEVMGDRIGFIGFSLSAKTAVYVGAFAPSIVATVAVDPHIALNGGTNYFDVWYLDWQHRFPDIHTEDYPIPELRGTVQSLLNPDVERPGFERNHHELLALAAPRPFLLIGGSQSEADGHDSDDLASWGYFNRAKEVYNLLGIGERLQFASTADGHHATGPVMDPAWQSFFQRWLKETPVEPGEH
ncbi:MAG: dienelactone hydrolase family protein [Bryobacterales bacterium]|nr:dienelactone hydrolase family protein [Bryobacterales bacterium]